MRKSRGSVAPTPDHASEHEKAGKLGFVGPTDTPPDPRGNLGAYPVEGIESPKSPRDPLGLIKAGKGRR